MNHCGEPSNMLQLCHGQPRNLLPALQQRFTQVSECLMTNQSLKCNSPILNSHSIRQQFECSSENRSNDDSTLRNLSTVIGKVQVNNEKILKLKNDIWKMKKLMFESKRWLNKNKSQNSLPIINTERALQYRQCNRKINELMSQLSQKLDILERKRAINNLTRTTLPQHKVNKTDQVNIQNKTNRICRASENLLMQIRHFLADKPCENQDYDI